MFQLNVLSGTAAGRSIAIRRFPFVVGRAESNDLVLAEAGVWERHLTLELSQGAGIQIGLQPGAGLLVNLQAVEPGQCLRNGDVISLGAVKLQFWLAAATQRSLQLRERLVWVLLAIVLAGELGLLCSLPH
jgi:pSer/pThr/pTyr-binding forkhead associated (FHA) protein